MWEQHSKTLGKAALPWAIKRAKQAEKRLTEEYTTAQRVWDRHSDDSWCILMKPPCHPLLLLPTPPNPLLALCFLLSMLISDHRDDFISKIYTGTSPQDTRRLPLLEDAALAANNLGTWGWGITLRHKTPLDFSCSPRRSDLLQQLETV